MITLITVLAANITPICNPVVGGIGCKDPGQAPSLFASVLAGLIGIILVLGSLWALFQLLQGGLGWISSGGDKTALEGARDRIINALIGLFILFAAWAVFIIILRVLGLTSGPGFELKFPTLL